MKTTLLVAIFSAFAFWLGLKVGWSVAMLKVKSTLDKFDKEQQ